MTIKTFCRTSSALWYQVEIVDNENTILFKGTIQEAFYSKYSNKAVKMFMLDYDENGNNIIVLYI